MEIYPEKIDNLNISMEYSNKENKDKFIDLKVGKEKISLKIPKSYSKIQLKTRFTNLKTEKDKLNIKNSYPKIERKIYLKI